uniref:Uncharacterized protein n=1 Tax=Opuntia streptacantha TaxID=393608 RepID=A0A7C8ZWY5_OPUST
MGILHYAFKVRNRFGLEEITGMDLMGPAPIGDCMQVFRKRSVFEELGFLVLGIFREGKGVVRGDAASQEEEEVPDVFPDFRGRGGGRFGRERTELARGDDGRV